MPTCIRRANSRASKRPSNPGLVNPVAHRPQLRHDVIERLGLLAYRCGRNAAELRTGCGSKMGGQPDFAFGPAAKVFATEAFISNSADLLDLAAPQSLLRGKGGLGLVEKGYRHSRATTIYGGTSEVLRSMVAEKRLGLPRSRA